MRIYYSSAEQRPPTDSKFPMIRPANLSAAPPPARVLVPSASAPQSVVKSADAVPAPARADGLLTPEEITRLVLLAKDAWQPLTGAGAIDEDFDAWRHREVLKAVRRNGLRDATHRDYKALRAHFLALAGKSVRAFKAAEKAAPEVADAEQARWLLQQACREFSGAWPGYPAAICARQYRCALAEATPRQLAQLAQLLFTIRNRGRAKRRKP